MEEDGNSTDRLSGFSEHAVSLRKGVFAEAKLGITSKSLDLRKLVCLYSTLKGPVTASVDTLISAGEPLPILWGGKLCLRLKASWCKPQDRQPRTRAIVSASPVCGLHL